MFWIYMDKIVTNIKFLKQECEDIQDIDEGLAIAHQLITRLVEGNDGIGLAANQIGINKKVCVIMIPEGDPRTNARIALNFVNPVIFGLSDPILVENEGCLSFPGERINTLRYNKMTVVDALAPQGRQLEGWRAICCQHETDHLQGITMHDRKFKKIKVNDRCPCGSFRKFKKCCMKVARKMK